MADLIDRGRFWDNLNDEFEMGVTDAIEAVNNALDNTPTVDAVPVVRCRDCKYSYFIRSVSGYECSRVSGPLRHGNDFCSYGEEVRNNG